MLVYAVGPGVTIGTDSLVVLSVVAAIAFAPIAVLLSYVIRVSTIVSRMSLLSPFVTDRESATFFFHYRPPGKDGMVVEQLDAPDPDALVAEAKAAFRDGAMLTVAANCEVEYEGRTSGYLGPGDRVLVAKPDGTFLVHQPTGNEPVNWMPGGGTVSAHTSEAAAAATAAESASGDEPRVAVLLARRTDPNERVEARILNAYGLTRFDATDGATYEESGTEAEMHEYIESDPEVLEEGLRIVEHERETKYGFVDFFARDAEGTPVVVEVKRIQATLDHFDQLRRYVSLYEEGEASPRGGGVTAENEQVRGMLVAPSASERVRRALRDDGLEFVELSEFDTDAKGSMEAKLTDF